MATIPKTLVYDRPADTAIRRKHSPLPAMLIVLVDLLTLGFSILVCAAVRQMFGGQFELPMYIQLWPVLGLFFAAFALYGLYPGVIFNPVMEIRSIAAATTTVYLVLGVLMFMLRVSEEYSRIVFVVAWILSMALVPPARMLVRHWLCRKPWWGYHALVLVGDNRGLRLLRTLERQPELGLRVSAVLKYEGAPDDGTQSAPVFEGWEKAPILASHYGITHAILASQFSAKQLRKVLDSDAKPFSHLYIVPDLEGLSSLGITAIDVGHILALEVSNRLLLSSAGMIKRIMDITIALAVGIIVLPLIALIAILIKLESKGPAFYRHLRIGRGEDRFRVWKFRSMVVNSDQVLSAHLEAHPEAKDEWERTRKLKNDPRITRMGRFLRRTSLDELPQLWNVIKGEMSLVGPRPIVTDEIRSYDEEFDLYTRVLPGITGLWQVSGRSDVSYEERVSLDTYYVRNWSPWLDIYILARTLKVVIGCRGAY